MVGTEEVEPGRGTAQGDEEKEAYFSFVRSIPVVTARPRRRGVVVITAPWRDGREERGVDTKGKKGLEENRLRSTLFIPVSGVPGVPLRSWGPASHRLGV